ncbi:MAG: 3-phosphoshikimate 1-carboxyvinyltransferase [Cyclobacteriaceae bacterium]|nr:3-phosphoshikimate 1-carboxyvinyltransferase [Cyclobacteriaceae bacterium]
MKEAIKLLRTPALHSATIHLPSSKSESNRALIINAFAGGQLFNLSEARDTQTMIRLLQTKEEVLDVLDAGTTMRFLTAFCALTDQKKILTGTARMCERPIGILVDALRQIGASINYLEKEGFPPIQTNGFTKQVNDEISIRGDISSQYISAILMVAPSLPNGLTLHLEGKIASRPYIEMTLELMRNFGAKATFTSNTITVASGAYIPSEFHIESDWSGASYWFSMVAVAETAEITLTGLKPQSLQGDNRIIEIMNQLGVQANFTSSGLLLRKKKHEKTFSYDFSDCPDLAQTVAVTCALKNIPAKFTGLESLKIKETDRILALQQELHKIHGSLIQSDEKTWKLTPATTIPSSSGISIETYDDHRMAMAFAPLALMMDVTIDNPSVVNKSYPGFWKDMEIAGFSIQII